MGTKTPSQAIIGNEMDLKLVKEQGHFDGASVSMLGQRFFVETRDTATTLIDDMDKGGDGEH